MNTKRSRFSIIMFICTVSVCALAQTNGVPEITGADEKIKDAIGKFSAYKFLLVPLVTIAVAAIKKWVAFIPDKFLPWCAPIIGALFDYAASKMGFWTGDMAAGAVMGGLATWGHQALFKQPLNEDDAPTGGVKPSLSVILCVGLLLFGSTTAMTCFGPNPERNVISVVQIERDGVTQALISWNDWLGAQRIIMESMDSATKAKRIADIQAAELKIKDAVADYNKANDSLNVAWDAYDTLKAAGTNMPPLNTVQLYADQVKTTSAAVVQIISLWVPSVKPPK